MWLHSEIYKKNVATSEMFSYVIGYYSVNVPSQPCHANIEIAEHVWEAQIDSERGHLTMHALSP